MLHPDVSFFDKGDNFCDFLYAILHNNPTSEKGQL